MPRPATDPAKAAQIKVLRQQAGRWLKTARETAGLTQAELAEKAKQKAEEERLEKQRAENCNRARSYAKSLQDGMRISRTNDKGESELLSDAQRAQEIARAQQVVSSDCK